MKTGKLIKSSYIYIAAFIITFLILVIAYMANGIFPGSEKNIFVSDMGAQYVGFYSYLRYLGQGFNTVMYQTMGALGGGYFGTWAYYSSDPINLVVLLFDPLRLADAIYYLTLIKISLCSVTFALYLKKGHIGCDKNIVILISSVSYALMSFNITYSLDIMWLSGSIMLPLVILGIDNILDSKRRELFIISLAYAVIANYYTAYMIVLYCVIYYIYRAACESYDVKRFFRHTAELFACGILSAFVSAWLWLPVLVDLSKGKFQEGSRKYYGLIREPLQNLRQFLPFSFTGITGNDAPPLYCGLLITVFFVLYFFQKKISLRKKISALVVTVVFWLSLSYNLFDVVWHCFRMPNGFPGRYSFVVSFFMISIFAESFDKVPFPDRKKVSKALNVAVCLFAAADVTVNSAYCIYSLDHDRLAGGYLKSESYYEFYYRNEIYKALGYTYPSRIASYRDYSHDDGFVFEVPSLDYYSSSYNYNISMFFRDLGMNSIFHYTNDCGLCPVSASVLNVNGAVAYSIGSSTEYSLMFSMYELVYNTEDFALYRNPYQGSLGYLYTDDTYSQAVSDDVFSNLNHLYHDFTGEDVFIRCEREDKDVSPIDENIAFAKEITIYPEAGKHIFMYISPNDYYRNNMQGCNDYLYFEGALVAYYTDAPDRYIVDLGYSDGSTLNFLFETDDIENEIFFYSFDDELFVNTVGTLTDRGLRNVDYSPKAIVSSITADKDCNLAIFLPYEAGYEIKVDGTPVEYSAYADCVLSIPVSEGEHNIRISYFTPGLKPAIIISLAGLLMLIAYIFFDERNRRKAKN